MFAVFAWMQLVAKQPTFWITIIFVTTIITIISTIANIATINTLTIMTWKLGVTTTCWRCEKRQHCTKLINILMHYSVVQISNTQWSSIDRHWIEPRKVIQELFSSAFYLPDSEFRIMNSRFPCLKSGCMKIPERKKVLVLDSSKRLDSGFRHIAIPNNWIPDSKANKNLDYGDHSVPCTDV